MNSKDQILLEQAYQQVRNFTPGSYKEIKERFSNSENILLESAYLKVVNNQFAYNRLVELDEIALDQLIEEAMGDWLKKAGSAIKGGYEKAKAAVKEKMSGAIANLFSKMLVGKLGDKVGEFLLKIKGFADGKEKLPPDAQKVANQVAGQPQQGAAPAPQQGAPAPTPVAPAVTKESILQNKHFLASTFFTETIILEALEGLQKEGLLTEARAARDLQKFAKEVANKINEIYPKNKKAMAAAIPKFSSSVAKYLGISPTAVAAQSSQQAGAQQGAQASQQGGAQQGAQASQQGGAQQGAQAGQQGGAQAGAQQGAQAGQQGGAQQGAPQGTGLWAKIKGYITKYPKISAGIGIILIGLIISAFAGVAPVLAPALSKAAIAGLGGGAADIVKQMIGNKMAKRDATANLDWKSAGKTALTAAAVTAVSSVLLTGFSNIARAFEVIEINTDSTQYQNGAYGETHTSQKAIRGLSGYTNDLDDAVKVGDKVDRGSFGLQKDQMRPMAKIADIGKPTNTFKNILEP
jgi:hypothetical protein